MAEPLRILVISGSSREGSYNRTLADLAARIVAEQGAQPNRFDLRDLALPIYDGDFEAANGPPAAAQRFSDVMAESDALFIAAPEYNGFPTPLLINAFDWLSRLKSSPGKPAGADTTAGKAAGLSSASPGHLGGLRSMNYVRQYLQMNFGMLVVPQQLAVSRAMGAFDEGGQLKDAGQRKALEGVVSALIHTTGALKSAASADA
jgi:chromate reductase, NAD(P)H dehydrogenase (quinone)